MKNICLFATALLVSIEAHALHLSETATQNNLQHQVKEAATEISSIATIPAASVTVATCKAIYTSSKGIPTLDSNTELADNPRFNIGSNAKSMLATIAARLVENKQISFDTTIAESGAFPNLPEDNPFMDVTLRELFSHTSGIATFHTGTTLNTVQVTGTASEQRKQFAELALNAAPAGQRGQAAYSNAGITVAGVIIEHITKTDVLELLKQELFQPLKLSAHMDDSTHQANGQPIGHFINEDGALVSYRDTDPVIPLFLQAAGYVFISANDYGKYLQLHLCGLRGEENEFLSAQSIQYLHDPVSNSPYALGWAKTEFAGENASFHVGGTGTFLAFAVILPKSGKAIGIMVNSASPEARSIAIEKLRELAVSQ